MLKDAFQASRDCKRVRRHEGEPTDTTSMQDEDSSGGPGALERDALIKEGSKIFGQVSSHRQLQSMCLSGAEFTQKRLLVLP